MDFNAILPIRPPSVGETRPAPDPSGVFKIDFDKHGQEAPDSYEHSSDDEEKGDHQEQEEAQAEDRTELSGSAGSLSVFA